MNIKERKIKQYYSLVWNLSIWKWINVPKINLNTFIFLNTHPISFNSHICFNIIEVLLRITLRVLEFWTSPILKNIPSLHTPAGFFWQKSRNHHYQDQHLSTTKVQWADVLFLRQKLNLYGWLPMHNFFTEGFHLLL